MNVGYFCTYIPEEIILSCHATPKFLFPDLLSPTQTLPYLPIPFCPFSKAILNDLLSEKNHDLDYLVFGGSCDAAKKLYDIYTSLQPKNPCYYLHIPLIHNEESLKFYRHSLHNLAENLFSFQGISQQNYIENLTKILNHSYQVKKAYSEAFFTGKLSGDFFLKEKKQPPSSWSLRTSSKVPVLLIASHLFVQDLIQLLEEKEFLVFDGSALGMRRYVFPDIEYPSQSDALDSLARWYLLNKVPCPGYDPQKRLDIVQKFINRVNLQGLVYFYPKFCDQALYELSFIKKHLKIPVLPIEHDTSFSSVGQWETRIDAFREVLSNR